MEMNFIKTEEELQNNDVYKKVKAICEAHGYCLYTCIQRVYTEGEKTYPQFSAYQKERHDFHPDVTFGSKTVFGDDYEFTIGTVSYGSLNTSDYEKFLNACNDTMEMVKELKEIDWRTWPCFKEA